MPGRSAAPINAGRFQAVDDLRGDFVRQRQCVRIGDAGVLEPEDVKVQLVALGEVVISKAAEAFGLLPFVAAMLSAIAGDGIIEVGALQRAFAQSETLVGA